MNIKDGPLLLHHIKVVQQTRELVGAIRYVALRSQLSSSVAESILKGVLLLDKSINGHRLAS